MSEQQTNKAESNPNLPQYMAEEIDRNPNGALAQAYKQSNGNLHDLLQIADRQGLIAQLPASMQGMVQEYQKDQQKARRDEEDFQRRMTVALAATVVAMGAAAEANAETPKYSSGRQPSYLQNRSYDSMSDAEKKEYLGNIAGMSRDQFLAQSEEQQKQDMLNAKAAAEKLTADALAQSVKINEETESGLREKYAAQGLSGKELDARVKADMDKYYATSSIGAVLAPKLDAERAKLAEGVPAGQTPPDIDPKRYKEILLEATEEQIKIAEKEQDPYVRAQALKNLQTMKSIYSGSMDTSIAGGAIDAKNQGDNRRAADDTIHVAGSVLKSTEALEAAKHAGPAATAKAYLASDNAMNKAVGLDDKDGQVRQAGDNNIEIGKQIDASVAKAEVKKGLADDGFGDEPVAKAATPAQPVAAARAPSINVGDPPKIGPNSSVLAQLGAPEEAAPADPAVQMQRKAPSAGMGASA